MSEVIATKLQEWRRKAQDGTMTPEEQREAIAAIRKERVGASIASSGAKERRVTKNEKLKAIDSDKLLDSFL